MLDTMQNERTTRLVLIAILCAVCFNFPVLRLIGKKVIVLGIPLLYFAIFLIWILVIIGTWLVVRSGKS